MKSPIKRFSFYRVFFYGGYLFLYLPIFIVILYSFNDGPGFYWNTASLGWYRVLFQNEALLHSLWTSFEIAFLSACLSTCLGTLCANAWDQPKYRGLGVMASMPLVVPEIVTGLSLLLSFTALQRLLGWQMKGFYTIVCAHTTLGSAYITAVVRWKLSSIDPTLCEAALDLRASPYKVFFLIKLPLIAPSLIAGWFLAFMISFDDVILASFTSGPGTTTLPLTILSSLKMGFTPQVNALASCIVCIFSLMMSIGYLFYQRDKSQ